MDRDTFVKYVEELREKQSKNPTRYQLWMTGQFVSFFLYLAFMLVLACVFIALAVLLALFHPILTLFLSTLAAIMLFFSVTTFARILLFRYEKPEGFELNREDAPLLFDRISEIGTALRTPRIHHILLNTDFNAAAVQVPRASIFGFYRNYVVIGVPFLLALDREHLDAVLAHEMAHISRYHGRMGCWIVKMANPMVKLMESVVFFNAFGGTFLHRFQYRFMNRLSASMLVLRRANEMEAQRLAARVAGARAVADCYALTKILTERRLKELWLNYYRLSLGHEEPVPILPHMMGTIQKGIPADLMEKDFAHVRNTASEFDSSHPSYREVAEHLGVQSSVPPIPAESAFGRYFDAPGASDKFESYWRKESMHCWRNNRTALLDRREKLDALLARQRDAVPSESESALVARYTAALSGEAAALPLYRQVYEKNPYQPEAAFHIGMDELRRYDGAGVDKVRQAVSRNIKYYGDGYAAIRGYYLGLDKTRDAETYADTQKKNAELYNAYLIHQNVLSDEMVYSNANLDGALIDAVRSYVTGSPVIRKAYATQKGRNFDRDVYVIVLEWSASARGARDKRREEASDDIRCLMECHDASVILRTNKDFYTAYYRKFKKLFCVRLK